MQRRPAAVKDGTTARPADTTILWRHLLEASFHPLRKASRRKGMESWALIVRRF
jgi:hypothetical protein